MNLTAAASATLETINAVNWKLFWEIRKDCGLDRAIDDPDTDDVPQPRYRGFRRTIGYHERMVRPRPVLPKASTDPRCQPQAGEMRLKEWIISEAAKENALPITIYHRFRDGKYPNVQVRHVPGRKAVFVRP